MPRTRKPGHPTVREEPDPIDVRVSTRLKQRRAMLEISQVKMAGMCGISYQQYQKYEQAVNRISASRLFQFAKLLDCDVNYFFDMDRKAAEKPEVLPEDEQRVLRVYRALSPTMRRRAPTILRSLAA